MVLLYLNVECALFDLSCPNFLLTIDGTEHNPNVGIKLRADYDLNTLLLNIYVADVETFEQLLRISIFVQINILSTENGIEVLPQ